MGSKQKSLLVALTTIWALLGANSSINALTLSTEPLFVATNAEPLVMLAMSNDHQLYYKAYTDYDDLDGDGIIDTTYNDNFNYIGYFDPNKCYTYSATDKFLPQALAVGPNDHWCNGGTAPDATNPAGDWSGNFLNWVTMSRMDILRKILYGGYRSTDNSTATVLERSYIPPDNHAWSKYFTNADLDKYTPYSAATYPTGITMCNVTPRGSSTDRSETNTTSPRLRIAKGRWDSWAAQESWQCLWDSEQSAASAESPDVSNAAEFLAEYEVYVKACVSGLVGSEDCKTYGSNLKPKGLLQEYGDTAKIKFGLMTGSYATRKSGGVLRKNITSFADAATPANGEVNLTTGIFTGTTGVISTLNKLRISRFEYSQPGYGDAAIDDCPFGQNTWNNGECSNWGNPMGELYLEALRYFVGNGLSGKFVTDDTPWISGLQAVSWVDPYGAAQTSPRGGGAPYCAKPNIIAFSTGILGFDHDEYAGASDVSGLNVNTETDAVGTGESIDGGQFYIGSLTGGSANDTCSAQTVNDLSTVTGLCPEAAGLQGSYKIAGLASFAHKTGADLNDAQGQQQVDTYAVALAPPIPEIKVEVPAGGGTYVRIIPAGYNHRDQNAMVLVNFQVVSHTGTTGEFFMNWENAPAGADHDSDFKGYLRYSVSGSTIKIIMHNTGSSAGSTMRMGYVIDGVADAGTHYLVSNQNVNSTASVGGGFYSYTTAAIDTACQTAGFAADPATVSNEQCHYTASAADRYLRGVKTHTAGASSVQLLKSPLWYAAKWGGFKDSDSSGTPNVTSEWDRKNQEGQSIPDGIPDNYFPVTDPEGLQIALNTAFTNLLKESGTASAVAVNTATLNTESVVYQAKFTSGVWSGQLLARPIDTDGIVALTPTWDAAVKLRSQNWDTERQIMTWNVDANAPAKFRWANIGAINQSYLNGGSNGDNRLKFLRGDTSNEGGLFRDRDEDGNDFKLGDIVNSAPVFVGSPPFLYRDSLEAVAYSTFRAARANRTPMVYVGANDGMLHGFNACTSATFPGCSVTAQWGKEQIAYVPSKVYPNLAALSDSGYTHQYYVDLTPTAGDIFGAFGTTKCGAGVTDCWRTIVVGGLRGGGAGYFALDVTDPSLFSSEDNASQVVLWEFTHPDLGYAYSEPTIARMYNGEWAVIFGSGYSSGSVGSDKASLFVVNARTGTLIAQIDLDTAGNGLSTPTVVDINGDSIADYIYAGDLKGNMWKINVKDSNTSQWQSFYRSGSTPQPLFQAKYGAGPTLQPITSRPEVGRHPDGQSGYMVYFGTGKYVEVGDNIPKSSPINTFYGIWDKDPTTGSLVTPISARSELLQQTILTQYDSGGGTYRNVSKNSIFWDGVSYPGPVTGTHKGWYLDLRTDQADSLGEMVVFQPSLRTTRVIFPTLIPQSVECSFGGDGFLMELDYKTGGATSFDVFDTNNDLVFNADDRPPGGNGDVVSGTKTGIGVMPDPTIIDDPGKGREIKIVTGSSGIVKSISNNPGPTAAETGRRSWRQLK